MACDESLVQYMAEQCSGAGEIRTRKMFGGYVIYCDGKVFGLICNDRLYIKITEAGRAMLPELETGCPYEGAKPHFVFSDIDDRDTLSRFVQVTCGELPMPKPKKNGRK